MNDPSSSTPRTRTVAHFELLERLGEGGMGVVWKARDTRLDRLVALKFLATGELEKETARRRLIREARAAAALNHPHIAAVHEIGEVREGPFIAMEYVEGETLRSRVRSGPVAMSQALTWGTELCDAIAEAHRGGVLHRDIKSGNVIITPSGRTKVLDFGLALRTSWEADATGGDADRLTETGMIVGTVDHIAPELLRGGQANTRTDVFSLGVVLYEILTGLLPFTGRTPVMVMNAILNEDPAPPSTLADDVPPELDDIAIRALAKEPGDRYPSAAELLDDLRALERRWQDEDSGAVPAAPELSASAACHNLPAQITSFVGRDRELETLAALLHDHRLLTITGSGGSGKTRVGLELAHRVLDRFKDGVYVVELASLTEGDEVEQVMARVLRLREESGRSLTDTLSEHLRSRSVLLVIDNCEHVIEACAGLITRLLQASAGLRVVATSRERLGVPGESVTPLPSLSIPANGTSRAPLEVIVGFEAVRLFVDRAGAAKSGFVVTERNAPTVVQICRRLDGVPLAIELAAARVRVLSVDQLLARLEDRFRVLTTGSRTSLPRQQTLQATVDWSVDLLTEDERRLFLRMSVFSGSFSLEAVERVCIDDNATADGLDLLARLVDKSLVVATEIDGDFRYHLLETLREYGATRLDALGETADLRSRHAAYFLEVAERADPELMGPEQARWFDTLDLKLANLHRAMRWFLASGQADAAVRLGGALGRLWLIRGYLSEGRALLAEALDAATETDEQRAHLARAVHIAGVLANDQGDYDAAREHFESCLAMRRALGDAAGEAQTLNSLGIAARDQGDTARARELLEDGMRIHEQAGNRAGVAASIHALGITAHREGDLVAARDLFERGFEIRRGLGDRRGIAALHAHLGSVAYDEGQYETASVQLEKGLGMFRELGNRRGIVWALMHLGGVAQKQGDHTLARTRYRECVGICRDIGDRHHLARCFEWVASLAAEEDRPERAIQLEGAARALREQIGSPRTPLETEMLDQELGTARQALGPDACDRAGREGRDWSLERAIEVALGE